MDTARKMHKLFALAIRAYKRGDMARGDRLWSRWEELRRGAT